RLHFPRSIFGDIRLADRHTLLVVEDNDDFYDALVDGLSGRYNVIRAAFADDALEILNGRSDEIDVVVLDMWLPRQKDGNPERNVGLEVLLKIKGRPTHPGIVPEVQVVVVTGHPDLQNAIESQRLGSFRYVIKGSPHMLDELLKDIAAAC